MPFRQSLLNFKASLPAQLTSIISPKKQSRRPTPPPTNSDASSETADYGVGTMSQTMGPLPTPSESDDSTLGNETQKMKQVAKGRAKRVKKSPKKKHSTAALIPTVEDEASSSRNVSGQTLVNTDNVSQISLMQNSITALNLPWSMGEVFNTGVKAEVNGDRKSIQETPDLEEESSVDEEAERERAEKAAAKKAKIEENRRVREEQRKEAADKATRRSSRASMLTKASDMVTEMASTVLGKRKESDSIVEPEAKRSRSMPPPPPVTYSKSKPRAPKDKKWLHSGLFAGQFRASEGRSAERKNAGTSDQTESTFKENSVLPLPMFAGDRLLQQGRDFKLPFDIFSPLDGKQPKPEEWSKSNKNKFVGDAAEEWRHNKYKDHSACMCRPETGCDDDCMNKIMYYECDEKNCNLGPEKCGNRAFAELKKRTQTKTKYNIGVEVIKTADRGFGVRSNRTFEPNQIIVEYSGEIINQEEVDRRMHHEYTNNESYYLMLFDQNMIIDATHKGSIARFVNHSCGPNCRMEKWTVGGEPRMALFAGDRGIMTGEELTYDYNFDPYSLKNAQICRCGEEGCRGILGPKPKEELRRKESLMKGMKRKAVEFLEDSRESIKKRKLEEAEAAAEKKKRASMKGWAYVAEPAKGTVEDEFHAMMDTAARTAKKEIKKASPVKANAPSKELARKPSKLKKAMKGAKDGAKGAKAKAVGISKKTSVKMGKGRVVSTTSAKKTLLVDDGGDEDEEADPLEQLWEFYDQEERNPLSRPGLRYTLTPDYE